MAAPLSLSITKHGQKGDRHLNMCRAYPSGSKYIKKHKRQKWERRSCNQVENHSSNYFTVAVKSNGDISAEPVRGQKIEEHVVTDLNLHNDENRPSLTSSTIAEEHH